MSEKSVSVALRIRPLVPNEISKGCKETIEIFQEYNQVRIKSSDKSFTYNYVFGPDINQDTVYNESVKNLVGNLFKGYNVTILAYGQTGSGKTHTMGTAYNGEGEMGVIPRAVQDIFNFVQDNFLYNFTISVSFMELYQEILYDLLSSKSRDQCMLEIREDPTKGIIIPGITEIGVNSANEVYEYLEKGSQTRATGATNMNSQSSRSHAIFTLNICMQSKENFNENKTAKFHLVDLAGSERSKKTGAVGTTFKEGININKGLLVLGNVISALGDEKQQHGFIPYRDSNLTRLLKDSLGGNSITLMIACISPADYNVNETLSTLRYADRARKIQNKPIINQDAKQAEINQLRKVIEELRLQVVGQGGAIICPAELELLKKENVDLRNKILTLTLQLSSTLNEKTGLLEKVILLQNANEKLHTKINELKNDYNTTLNDISLSIEKNDQKLIQLNLDKFKKIEQQFIEIDVEQKETETEIRNHELIHESIMKKTEINENINSNTEMEINDKQETYTNKQMALNIELQELTKNLAMKEHLAQQIHKNTQYMVDYTAIAEHEGKIVSLQKEKDELLQQLKNVQQSKNGNKLAEQRRKRVQELETQIQELNKKVQGQARLIKLKEKDELKIKNLNNEILQMKQTKVRLIRNMREESENFRTWKMQRERELIKLRQEDRKKQNQMIKMEAMHNKQQNVLKRKVEEAAAINKRLKDALALRKAAQDNKNHGRIERIGNWIKHELEIYVHSVEAEATLEGLLEDRATLHEQLDNLKQNPDENLEQIKIIEDDIELRCIQIQDLQQKLLDIDEDNKSKTRFDNIQTMSEAKFALRTLFEDVADIKKKEVNQQTKIIELQTNQTELTEKINNYELMIKSLEIKSTDNAAQLQREYEEKVAVLLRQLRGVQVNSNDDELNERCLIQQEQLEEKEKIVKKLQSQLNEFKKEIEEKEKKLSVNLLQENKSPVENQDLISKSQLFVDNFSEEMHTPNQSKVSKQKSNNDTTFVLKQRNAFHGSYEEDMLDDVERDPDWRKTPIGKWLNKRKQSTLQSKQTTLDPYDRLTRKRTSEGSCTCTKNCSNRCGCKKSGKKCTATCKCSKHVCKNMGDENGEITSTVEIKSNNESDSDDDSFKKPRSVDDATCNINLKRSRLDFN